MGEGRYQVGIRSEVVMGRKVPCSRGQVYGYLSDLGCDDK